MSSPPFNEFYTQLLSSCRPSLSGLLRAKVHHYHLGLSKLPNLSSTLLESWPCSLGGARPQIEGH
jgi:hypothetical protein